MSIEVSSVTKVYGSQKALNNINFSIEKGSIVGFLGPNGAGKSTMMKILTGFINPTEGAVLVNGINVLENPIEAQKSIGYLPENNPLYAEMYVKEYLQFQASIYKVAKENVAEIIEKVGLTPEVHKKIGQLSKGYQQRVGIAQAILHEPDIIILDEPTVGLDPQQLLKIRELVKELAKNACVIFSSHMLNEVQAVADRIIIMHQGEVVHDKVNDGSANLEKLFSDVIFDRAATA